MLALQNEFDFKFSQEKQVVYFIGFVGAKVLKDDIFLMVLCHSITMNIPIKILRLSLTFCLLANLKKIYIFIELSNESLKSLTYNSC